MNTPAHRATHRMIVAVIAITLSIFSLTACSDGSYTPGSLAKSFPCVVPVVVEEDTTLWQFTLATQPDVRDRWTEQGEQEWQRLIMQRSGFYRQHIAAGTQMQLPALCSEPRAKRPQGNKDSQPAGSS